VYPEVNRNSKELRIMFQNLIHIFQISVGFGNECFLFISGNHYEQITCYLTSKTRQIVWIRNASDLCWL